MRYSEARGTLIYEKNLKSKILCQTPFNRTNRSFFLFVHIQKTVFLLSIANRRGTRKKEY
jgi:hypothetical protein